MIAGRWRWISLADAINTAALLNQAMQTGFYNHTNVSAVPLDVIHTAAALLSEDEA